MTVTVVIQSSVNSSKEENSLLFESKYTRGAEPWRCVYDFDLQYTTRYTKVEQKLLDESRRARHGASDGARHAPRFVQNLRIQYLLNENCFDHQLISLRWMFSH